MQTVNDILRDAFNKIKDEHGLILHKLVFENGDVELSASVTGKQWVCISRHQIKDVKVGDAIRINGVETRLSGHYSSGDCGFDTQKPFCDNHGYGLKTFSNHRWYSTDDKVEVLR